MPEIEIEEWTTTGECDFKYVAKGHHNEGAFRAAVAAHEAEAGADPIDAGVGVHHRWFLVDDKTGLAKQVPPAEPGAVAYTETDWF